MSDFVAFGDIEDYTKLTSEDLSKHVKLNKKIKDINEERKLRCCSEEVVDLDNECDDCKKLIKLENKTSVNFNKVDQKIIDYDHLKEFYDYIGNETKEDILSFIIDKFSKYYFSKINLENLSKDFYIKNKKQFLDKEIQSNSFLEILDENEAIEYLSLIDYFNYNFNFISDKFDQQFFIKLVDKIPKKRDYRIEYFPLKYRRECYDFFNKKHNTFEICEKTVKITDYDEIVKRKSGYIRYLADDLSFNQIKEVVKFFPELVHYIRERISDKFLKELFYINHKILNNNRRYENYDKEMLLKYLETNDEYLCGDNFKKYVNDKDVQEKMLIICRKKLDSPFYEDLSEENKLKLDALKIIEKELYMEEYIPEKQKDLAFYKKFYELDKRNKESYFYVSNIPEKYLKQILLEE